MIICIILSFLPGCVPEEEGREIYFVQITDTHFDESGSRERIEKVISSVNQLPMKIECVIHTGDITQEKLHVDSTVKNAIELFAKFKMPVHFLPGNHDILQNDYDRTKKSYIEHFGDLFSYREYNGVVFLTLFTEPLARAFIDSTYDPLEELENMLDRTDGKPVIVCHHAPSVGDFYRNKMHKGWGVEEKRKWVDVLNSYNVKALIAGHFHRDEHHWLGEIPLYVCSPVSAHWDRQLTYRIYHYKDGQLGYRTQYVQ